MVAWSSVGLKNIAIANFVKSAVTGGKNGLNSKAFNYVPARTHGHQEFVIRSSRYIFQKFKDLLNFYILIGVIPLGAIVAYTNIFIGPPKLAVIPEGYEPKDWEYYKHPITRFLARYVLPSIQEIHERALHNVFRDQELREIRKLEKKVKNLISERQDYQAWYFEKPVVKYARETKHILEKNKWSQSGITEAGVVLP